MNVAVTTCVAEVTTEKSDVEMTEKSDVEEMIEKSDAEEMIEKSDAEEMRGAGEELEKAVAAGVPDRPEVEDRSAKIVNAETSVAQQAMTRVVAGVHAMLQPKKSAHLPLEKSALQGALMMPRPAKQKGGKLSANADQKLSIYTFFFFTN
jgi:hypothetical protein